MKHHYSLLLVLSGLLYAAPGVAASQFKQPKFYAVGMEP
jgi:hypothetical protein